MHRILIVDNEPIIVDGLFDLFYEAEDLELDVLKAYSAADAIQQLKRHNVDVIFADIHMPGMNGIELQQKVKDSWPRCKVIFLTGFNEFTYVQTALRNGGADYILKSESDERIMEALRNTIASIHESDEKLRFLTEAKRDMELAKPLLQKEFLIGVLDGECQVTQMHLDERGMPLNGELPVLLVLGRIDEGMDKYSPSEQLLMLFAMHNIAQEYLTHSSVFPVVYDSAKFVWFLQPKATNVADCSPLIDNLHETLDVIQQTCKQLLKLSISIVTHDKICTWEDVPSTFSRLLGLLRRGLGLGKEVLLTDAYPTPIPLSIEASVVLPNQRSKLKLLEQYLNEGAYEPFCVLCHSTLQQATSNYYGYMDIYYGISSLILSYITSMDISQEVVLGYDLEGLLRIEEQPTWEAASYRLQDIVKQLFDNRKLERDENNHFIINRLHRYIHNHLGDDLSLNVLSKVVHLNASYLSRLYKQLTGHGLAEYITEKKLEKAMDLLKQTSLKVHEIAGQIGWESGYFIKTFKRGSMMTPQEYREKITR
jgi:two-component system response regulator YesN